MQRNDKFHANFLKAIESYKAGEIELSHFPIVAYIEPTTFCNLGCPSCPTGLKTNARERSLLSYVRFCRLIDEFGDYLALLYMYNWGEPFLNKEFIRMVAFASQKGIQVHSSSNFNVELDQKKAEQIVTSGLMTLKVGIDGIKQETYEKYRRGGNLERVLKNVTLISEAKRKLGSHTPQLIASFHVFEHNEHELPFARDYLLEKGLDIVGYTAAYIPCSDIYGVKSPQKYPQFDIKSVYANSIPKDADVAKCSWLWFAIVYNPNGSISPCCAVTYEKYDFGKMKDNDFISDVYNWPKYKLARVLKKRVPRIIYNDSMGLSIGQDGKEIKIICETCPAPYIMNNFSPDNLIKKLGMLVK
jgi:hypothetical protein